MSEIDAFRDFHGRVESWRSFLVERALENRRALAKALADREEQGAWWPDELEELREADRALALFVFDRPALGEW